MRGVPVNLAQCRGSSEKRFHFGETAGGAGGDLPNDLGLDHMVEPARIHAIRQAKGRGEMSGRVRFPPLRHCVRADFCVSHPEFLASDAREDSAHHRSSINLVISPGEAGSDGFVPIHAGLAHDRKTFCFTSRAACITSSGLPRSRQ